MIESPAERVISPFRRPLAAVEMLRASLSFG